MNIGCVYDFSLYSKRARKLGGVKVVRTEGARLAIDLEPMRVRDTTGTGAIRWDRGSGMESEIYAPSSPRFTCYYAADSADAVERLEGLRAKEAEFLLFPRTAFWWLDHYPEFKAYLKHRYRATVDAKGTNDARIIFNLRHHSRLSGPF